MRRILVIVLMPLALGACAALDRRPQPLEREEIVRMAQSGASAEAIIERLKATDTVIFLSASEIVRLHQQGVPQEVLDWMQRAQIEEIRRREIFRGMHGFYIGGPYPCPGYRLGPYPYGPWRGPWCY